MVLHVDREEKDEKEENKRGVMVIHTENRWRSRGHDLRPDSLCKEVFYLSVWSIF